MSNEKYPCDNTFCEVNTYPFKNECPSEYYEKCVYTKARQKLDRCTAAFDKMHEVCLNAIGAYEAIELMGADKHLPGYNGCLERLNEAMEFVRKAQEEK